MPENNYNQKIAVIGMAGRFPGASNLEEFWNNLINGVESLRQFSDEELLSDGIDPSLVNNPNYIKSLPVLDNAEAFDAGFFGYTPREALMMDPQQRILLECSWSALEDSGYNPDGYAGKIGVFAGCSLNSYLLNNVMAHADISDSSDSLDLMIGNDKDFTATRIAFKLNLTGPAVNVQTACSTGLVAVHLACQSLLNYECDIALTGASTVHSPRNAGYLYKEGLIVSKIGHCRPFDADADGTVFGEGVGVVVLKRLEDAVEDGDVIDAVIIGSAINNDGSAKAGYTAPSIDGQVEVLSLAQSIAEVDLSTVSFIETHGTGTILGDPIEFAALKEVYGGSDGSSVKGKYCTLGSVKANIGHLDSASGIAGLIKTVLCFKNKQLPPLLNFNRVNPEICLEGTPFQFNSERMDWNRLKDEKSQEIPLRAGVTSLGVGGTNAHLIMEEAPLIQAESKHTNPSISILPLSARTPEALIRRVKDFQNYLETHPGTEPFDTAYTLRYGRKEFEYRKAVVTGCTQDDVLDELERVSGILEIHQGPRAKESPQIVFLFPGQGSQYLNMAKELYGTQPVFRDQFDHCVEILQRIINIDIRTVVYPDSEESGTPDLNDTQYTQPVLFALEYSLAVLWKSWGIEPDYMLGHSLGEYTAACVAGVFTLEQALEIVAKRGRIVHGMPDGRMAAIFAPLEEIRNILPENLTISAYNSPGSFVISGTPEAVEQCIQLCADRDIKAAVLKISHPFHCSIIADSVEALKSLIAGMELNPPDCPFISNVTGTWITPQQAVSPDYWASQLINPVMFSAGIETLSKEKNRVFLEVGPGSTLTTLVLQHQEIIEGIPCLYSLPHPREKSDSAVFIMRTLAGLWERGILLDWKTVDSGVAVQRIMHLPFYPFERTPFWLESKKRTKVEKPASTAALSVDSEDILYSVQPEPVLVDQNFSVIVTGILSRILGIPSISPEQDFFDLGGHSLLAAQVVYEINRVLHTKFTSAVLLANPLVGDFVQVIEAEMAEILPEPESSYDESLHEACLSTSLSTGQRRLWFFHQLEPENPAYNLALSLRLEGLLDLDLLHRSIEFLVSRHETFHTCFISDEGQPRILVESVKSVELMVKDADNNDFIRKEIFHQAEQVFDLTVTPIFRFILYRLSENEHSLILFIPHILIDGWSFNVFRRELIEVYAALTENRQPVLPELTVQYAEFAALEKKLHEDADLRADIRYWKKYLGDADFVLEFPYDRKRSSSMTSKGKTAFFSIPGETARKIGELCHTRHVTPFLFFMASLHLLLHKYTDQMITLIGAPYANRDDQRFENVMGFFLNMLAVKADFSKILSFLELLDQVKSGFYSSLQHKQLSFDELLVNLEIERQENMHPVFQVMLAYQSYLESETDRNSSLRISEEFPDRGLSEYDLSFYLWETESGIDGALEYSTDLFNTDTIQRIVSHFTRILEVVAENNAIRVSDISLLTPAEHTLMIDTWNSTARDYSGHTTFLELFDEAGKSAADSTAVICNDRSISYKELNLLSGRIGGYLSGKGVGRGAKVGICLDRSINMIAAVLGVLKTGAAYIPLDPSFPRERLNYMIESSQLSCIISDKHLLDHFNAPESTEILQLESVLTALDDRPWEQPEIGPDDLAYVIYTSGSTGKPKGVKIHHKALLNFLLAMRNKPGIEASDRMLALTTLSFDISCLELYLPLICGATVVLADSDMSKDIQRLPGYMEDHKVSVMQATPAMYKLLLDGGWVPGKGAKLLCGGEAMSRDLAQALVSASDEVWNMYGPTETTVWSSVSRVEGGDRAPLIGRPVDNTTMYILDSSLNPVPIGVSGELYIGGDGVSRGYLNRDDLTSERFISDPFSSNPEALMYKTGDVCRYHGDGNIEYIGRSDFQVKLRGYRIELGEIENVLLELPGVQQAVCHVIEKSENDKRLAAYLISESRLDEDYIRGLLKETLPDYMIPNHVVYMDTYPLTPNGKINRNALPEPDVLTKGKMFVHPRTDEERQMLDVWKDVLKQKEISLNDNFFHIGGHSLLAAQLIFRLNEVFGKNWTLKDLFLHPTIQELILSRKEDRTGELSLLFPVNKTRVGTPFFLVAGVYGENYYLIENEEAYAKDFLRYFSNIISFLNVDMPVYGIRPRGIYRGERFKSDVQEMAEEYIREIKKIQPEGPYRIGGECLGGIIAYEIARQLKDAGDSVDVLVLMDTYYIAGYKRVLQRYYNLKSLVRLLLKEVMKTLANLKNRDFVRRQILNLKAVFLPVTKNEKELHDLLLGSYIFASRLTDYTTEKLDCCTLLIANQEWDRNRANLGWTSHILPRLDIRVVPGDHSTRLTIHGENIGKLLRDYLSYGSR